MNPYRVLERKRAGERLSAEEIGAVVAGAASSSWSDAQLAAFLMAVAIRGLDAEETRALTRAMLESGEQWDLAAALPGVVDKHSTGGVGDKVSLLLAPLLAACDVPVVMLTGRSLGHSGGTADKLESIPGLDLAMDRARCLGALEKSGLAIGIATDRIAPADRRLYALRDATATVTSVPLVIGSILSKKLAAGAAAIVFDVKTGEGAFFPREETAVELARRLVETTELLGRRALALVTDMSQPLGEWVGNTAEVMEVFDCFAGRREERLLEVTLELCREAARLVGSELSREALLGALDSGAARERFERWAAHQGAEPSWLRDPVFPLAPEEMVLEAPQPGVLSRVHTRQLGMLMQEAGAGRFQNRDIDHGVALRVRTRLGERIEVGQELARLYLRRSDEGLASQVRDCFEIGNEGVAPALFRRRLGT